MSKPTQKDWKKAHGELLKSFKSVTKDWMSLCEDFTKVRASLGRERMERAADQVRIKELEELCAAKDSQIKWLKIMKETLTSVILKAMKGT